LEFALGREAIARYVLAGWTLADEDGAPVVGRLEDVAPVQDSSSPKVDIVLRFAAERDLAGLTIDFALFRESDPFHRDHCEIAWNGAEPAGRLLWVEDPTWRFVRDVDAIGASAFDVVGAFVRHGVEHILLGFDHVAFVVALVLGARRWRSILAVVTAFTLAHSVTLALAAFEVVTLPASLVEPAIALSIAWVAARNLTNRAGRAPWIEAAVFGLIHGLGFAGAIGETLASEPRRLSALAGFNLGVEAGQIAVVAALLGLFALARSAARAERRGEDGPGELVPHGIVRAASLVVAVLGVYGFVERVGS
jgi:hydrogenase/urease accessory protein HupE